MEKHKGWDLCGLPITEIIDPVFPRLKGARLPQFPQCDFSRIVWILALTQHILWSCPQPPYSFPALGLRRVRCPVHPLVLGAGAIRRSIGCRLWLHLCSTWVCWFFWVRYLSCRTLWAQLTRWCSELLTGKQCLWDEIWLVTDLSVQTRGNDPSRKKTILKIQTERSWIPPVSIHSADALWWEQTIPSFVKWVMSDRYLRTGGASESEVAQLCLSFCDHMDFDLRGSSIHGIFQARILQWIAISFSRGSSQPRDGTWVSLIAGRRFTIWAAGG